MRRIMAAVAIAALGIPATSAAAGSWHVVANKTVSGQYAATVADATIAHPNAIEVTFIHGTGDVAWVCSRGFSVAEWSGTYGAGAHQLAHVAGQGSCTVTAEVSGSGKVAVEILKR
jgi:hypothetical protein